MDMDEINNSDKVMRIWKEFGIKTHNFTNPLLVQHNSHHLQTKPHSITLTTHTNENKQFWPMYKVMTITKIWKYSVLVKN